VAVTDPPAIVITLEPLGKKLPYRRSFFPNANVPRPVSDGLPAIMPGWSAPEFT